MISIIIPTYNHRRALEQCLQSIVAQTYKDFEVIVVDDGSTDGTKEWFNAQEPPLKIRGGEGGVMNVRMFFHEVNHGAPAARNRGAQEAKGAYVLFCDADVVMQPHMLERMMQTLAEHKQSSYAYSSFKFGWKTFRLFPFDGEKLKRMPYIHSTSLIRREHFPKAGWDESLRRLQDWDLWLTMFQEGHVGVWIPEVLFTVKARRNGISQWLPAFAYTLMPWLPIVQKYKMAVTRIRVKHHL